MKKFVFVFTGIAFMVASCSMPQKMLEKQEKYISLKKRVNMLEMENHDIKTAQTKCCDTAITELVNYVEILAENMKYRKRIDSLKGSLNIEKVSVKSLEQDKVALKNKLAETNSSTAEFVKDLNKINIEKQEYKNRIRELEPYKELYLSCIEGKKKAQKQPVDSVKKQPEIVPEVDSSVNK